jgi:hypothetical protein
VSRTARSRALFVLYNLVVVLLVSYAVWWRYRARVTANRLGFDFAAISQRTGLPPDVVRSIGMLPPRLRADLVGLSAAHPGTIRVGALGDSFTFGAEVRAGNDFPALLVERFRRAGMGNVEVLNLGVNWTGLSQTYRLWTGAARRLAFDFVLLGPQTLFFERDETFNHAGDDMPDYLHGRYVLDGDDLAFIDVEGDGNEDRLARYLAFVPRWRYLRYDRRAPAALRAWLPAGWQLGNPIYYATVPRNEERDRLYHRLLDRFSREAPQTIFLHPDPELARLGDGVGGPLAWAAVPMPSGFPYRRPHGHLSQPGNAWLAEVYFAWLTGAVEQPIEVPELTLVDARRSDPRGSMPRPLSDHQHFDVRLGPVWAGTLVEHRGMATREDDERVALDAAGVRSLLALEQEGRAALDGPLLPLDFVVAQGADVTLVLKAGASDRRVLIGRVSQPSPELALGVVAVRGLYFDASGINVRHATVRGMTGALEIDGRVIAEVTPTEDRGALRVLPRRPWLDVVPLADTRIDVSALPGEGEVTVELDGASPLRARIGTYRRRAAQIAPGPWPPERVIRPAQPGRGEITSGKPKGREPKQGPPLPS